MDKLKLQPILDLIHPDSHKLNEETKYDLAIALYDYMINEIEKVNIPTAEELADFEAEARSVCYEEVI